MVEAYPNLEILKLTTSHPVTVPYDDDAVLSALCFPNLTSLTLSGFRLWDGAFLLEVNVLGLLNNLSFLCIYIFSDHRKVPETAGPSPRQ